MRARRAHAGAYDRVVLETLPVQIASDGPVLRLIGELIRAQVELVGLGARGHVTRQRLFVARRQRDGQRLDDPAGERVLQLEDVAKPHARRLRPPHGAARHVGQLGGHAQLVAAAKNRSGQHRVDVGFGQRLEIHGVRRRSATAVRLDRTRSDSSPESDVESASERLNDRKSISGSGRSMRNGRTMRRVIGRGAA